MRNHHAMLIVLVALAAMLLGGVAAADPYFDSEFVFIADPGFANCHGPCLIRLANGDLVCAWQAQSTDEAIHYSRKAAGSTTWTAPATLANDPSHNDVNPVVWQDPTGKVWCFYDVRTAVEWATTQLKYTTSTDNGHTWSAPVNMVGQLGYNLRCHAFVAGNGSWILPVYDERDWTSLMFISTNQGAVR